jgi:hypothetical protein
MGGDGAASEGGAVRERHALVTPLVAAALGFVALAAGVALDPARACFAYLAAWTYATTLALGALLLLMLGHAAKASWMVVTRRLTEAVVAALPLLLLLFLPIAASLPRVYPWARDLGALDDAVREAVLHKRHYLSPGFFVARSVVYFAIFIAVGSSLRRWSIAGDARPDIAWTHKMRALSGGAFPVVGLALTWAAFDWTMSLQPAWSSTIFGLYFFAGGFVGAVALVCVLAQQPGIRAAARVTGDHGQALGRVLFAMIVFWAYMAFSQLLIYWIADVPDEVSFYAARVCGSWAVVTGLLVVGHFALPFFSLLSRRLKRRPGYLGLVGAWMLVMHWVDVYWLILPVHDARGVRPHWVDLGALAFVGGLTVAWSSYAYRRAAPLPRYAPELAEGIDYEAAL